MTVYGFNVFTKGGTVFIDNMVFDDPCTRDKAVEEIRQKLLATKIEDETDMRFNIHIFNKHINSEHFDYVEEMNKVVNDYKTIGEW